MIRPNNNLNIARCEREIYFKSQVSLSYLFACIILLIFCGQSINVLVEKSETDKYENIPICICIRFIHSQVRKTTPPRTHRISGLKSQALKPTNAAKKA